MRLCHAAYFSRRSESDQQDVADIVGHAQARNAERNVTGGLVVHGGYFFQVLEGDRQVLTRLITRIFQDPRHTGCELLLFDEIGERMFPDWTMRAQFSDDIVAQALNDFGLPRELQPETLSGYAVWDLVHSLVCYEDA